MFVRGGRLLWAFAVDYFESPVKIIAAVRLHIIFGFERPAVELLEEKNGFREIDILRRSFRIRMWNKKDKREYLDFEKIYR